MKEITFKKADTVRVIAELASYIDSLQDDKEYKLEIKERKEKRSLSANNYYWVMADKLAEKLRSPSTRREWIEITVFRHSLHRMATSPSTRREWIEIFCSRI